MKLWMRLWKQYLLESLDKLPIDLTVALSGGRESSMIVYGLIELNKCPKQVITFKMKDFKESKDLYYTKKICSTFNIHLDVVEIPKLPKQELINDLKDIILFLPKIRLIDLQVCYAFKHMLKQIKTKNIAIGFYSNIHYFSGGGGSSSQQRRFNDCCKGKASWNDYIDEFNHSREAYWEKKNASGAENNYEIICKYIRKNGITSHLPLYDKQLYEFSKTLTFWDYHIRNGKWDEKYFVELLFQDKFDLIGNNKNTGDMHVKNNIKKYFIETFGVEKYNNIIPIINNAKKMMKVPYAFD